MTATVVAFAATCTWAYDERGEPCRPCNTHGRWTGATRTEAIQRGEMADWVFIINPDSVEALCPRHADPSDKYSSHGQLYNPRREARQMCRWDRRVRRQNRRRKVRTFLGIVLLVAVLLYVASR